MKQGIIIVEYFLLGAYLIMATLFGITPLMQVCNERMSFYPDFYWLLSILPASWFMFGMAAGASFILSSGQKLYFLVADCLDV